MHPTKNDLPADVRQAMADLLNARLADAIDLMLQSKQAHWNVKGMSFIALHELFDEIHAASKAWVDTIAERAVILGGTARGTIASVSAGTHLPPYDESITDGRAHVDAFSTALATFGKHIRASIDTAEKKGDADTADLFTEVSRGVDKMTWFVEAHLQRD